MAIAPTVGKKALVVNMFDGGTGTTVGLKIDVKRFNDACTYIDNAQQNIKNCRDSLGCISNAKPGLASLTEFKSLESIFNNSKLDKLATKIESIKGKIIQLDENFATEYMKLAAKKLQDATNTINSLSKKKFEEMTPGERKTYNAAVEKYNNAVKDYDETLLYMLEKYEEDGMLNPEMAIQLQCQRIVVQQHEIEAKLSSIKDQLSDEYRKLYEEYSNNQRKLIQLNPNLTEEERQTQLADFEATYNDYLKSSTEAKANREQEEKLIKELEELYNQGASKATIISKKQEIADVNSESPYAPTADELEYMDMNGFEKVMVNTGTFIASTFTGVLSVAEGVVDGSVMLISGAGAVFGADTKWAESYIKTDIAGSLYDDIVSGDLASAFVFGATSVAETIIDSTLNVIDDVGSRCGADTKWAEDFASIDISGAVYEETKDLLSMNEVIAYGDAHTAGNFFGETGTHLALTFLAPWATATVNGLEGMGSKAEQVLLEDGSYQEAFGRGFLSGVGSAVSGYAMSSFNSRFISSGAFKTIGQTIFNTVKTEGFKGLVQGLGKVGGKQLRNIALNSLRDVDSWVETGCVLGDNILSGIADEEIDWGKTFTQTAMVFLAEFAANFLMGTASDIAAPKLTHMLKQAELESAFNGPEADAYFKSYADQDGIFADVYKQTPGVEHTSGIDVEGHKGSLVDSNAIEYNRDMEEYINNPFDVGKATKTQVAKQFYDTPNPELDFKGMKPSDQLDEFRNLIASGKNESEALMEMLDNYEQKFVPEWGKAEFRQKLQMGYNNLLKAGDNISWDDYLKMQLQIVPYNPELQIPNTYNNWKKAVESSTELSIFYKTNDVRRLVNEFPAQGDFNYGNGLGRAAKDGYSSALFAVPGSECKLPDNWDSLTKSERANWTADTVQLNSAEFEGGCYKIDIDKNLFNVNDIVPTTSQTLGANGMWGATMTPLGSSVFEVKVPRIENVLNIDSNVQKMLNQAISENDITWMIEIFDKGLKDGTIVPKKGVVITPLY